ncbi:MAG: PepSY-associated TM helix domain-containing protein, partial [Pseudomonadota bacterium]
VNFSGAMAMFVDELRIWEEPAARASVERWVGIQQIIDRFVEETDEPIHWIEVTRPYPGSRFYPLRARYGETDPVTETYRYDAETGSRVSSREGDGVAVWLQQFHRYLAIEPKMIGRVLVGLTGVYMLVLVLSGIVTHQRIIRDLFKIRWHRAARTKMRDLHNVTGLWSLPFALVIAFTGIMVGAPPLLAVVAGLPMTGGDIAQLEAILAPAEEPESWGHPIALISADEAIQIVAETTDFVPLGIRIERYGHRNAAYSVMADSPGELRYVAQVPVDAVSGAVDVDTYARTIDGLPASSAARVFFAASPLHYGRFGPITLKVLYYALGMIVSVCIAYGMLIYFERRLTGSVGHLRQQTYQRLSLVNAGVLAGLPVVTLLTLFLDRLFTNAGEARYSTLGVCFFSAWVACVIYACLDANARRAGRRLMATAAALALTLPVFDLMTANVGFTNTAVLVIHGVAVCSGLCLVWYLVASARAV